MKTTKDMTNMQENGDPLVWQLYDNLRGVHSFEESRNLILALVFLKAIRNSSTSSNTTGTGDPNFAVPEQSSWSHIVAASSCEPLLNAFVAFDDHPANRAFEQPFKVLGLYQLSDIYEAYRRVIKGIEEANSIDAHALFLNVLTASSKSTGEFSTPTVLLSLAAELLNPSQSASIYDPTCGEGGMLLSAYQSALKRGNSQQRPKIFGQDNNPQAVAVARLNLALHGLPPTCLALGDTLLDPQYVVDGELHQFDYVICQPPFGLRLSESVQDKLDDEPYRRFSYGISRKSADFLFIQHILASLNDRGRAVLIAPPRVLFVSGVEGDIRRKLVEADLVETVIALPSGVLKTTGIPIAILILTKSKEPAMRGKVQFIHADKLFDDAKEVSSRDRMVNVEQHRKLVSVVTSRQEEKHFARIVALADIARQDYRLTPAAYMDFANMESFLGGSYTSSQLSEIADILEGTHFGKSRPTQGPTPIISGRDLTTPNLVVDDLKTVAVPDTLTKPVYAEKGDVLLQRLSDQPKALFIDPHLHGVLIADSVHIVRLREQYRDLGRYLTEFLNSERGQAYLSLLLGGPTESTVELFALHRLVIPIPDKLVLDLIEELHKAEYKLLTRIVRTRALRRQLFAIENAEKASAQLHELSLEAKVLDNTVIQSDDLSFRIRNFYPYCIAYAYRTLDAIHQPTARYAEQLRVAENIMAFLALVGLAMAAHLGKFTDAPENLLTAERLREFWRGGISPGDWQAIGRQSGGLMRSARELAAADMFGSLWFRGKGGKESPFAANLKTLVGKKNDFKHDRGPRTDDEYKTGCSELNKLLEFCLTDLAFLIQYPIRLIEDCDQDWLSQQFHVHTLIYHGDHPGLRQEQLSYAHPVSKNHLYMELGSEKWASLYPLITVQYCPSCKTRETYFVDYFEGPEGNVKLKSFERGHTHENDEIAKKVARDLDHWLSKVFRSAAAQ